MLKQLGLDLPENGLDKEGLEAIIKKIRRAHIIVFPFDEKQIRGSPEAQQQCAIDILRSKAISLKEPFAVGYTRADRSGHCAVAQELNGWRDFKKLGPLSGFSFTCYQQDTKGEDMAHDIKRSFLRFAILLSHTDQMMMEVYVSDDSSGASGGSQILAVADSEDENDGAARLSEIIAKPLTWVGFTSSDHRDYYSGDHAFGMTVNNFTTLRSYTSNPHSYTPGSYDVDTTMNTGPDAKRYTPSVSYHGSYTQGPWFLLTPNSRTKTAYPRFYGQGYGSGKTYTSSGPDSQMYNEMANESAGSYVCLHSILASLFFPYSAEDLHIFPTLP